MSPVLVSALYDLARLEGSDRRRIEEYLRLGRLLLDSRHPLVVFADPSIAAEVARRRRGTKTRVVELPFEELPHSQRVAAIESCFRAGGRGRASTNPTKDTSRYVALMWSKAALVARAAESFFADAEMFWWVDFGLAHAAAAHPELGLDELLDQVQEPIHLTVRWQPTRREVEDRVTYYRDTSGAKVGGSFFGAHRRRARWLADRMADEVELCLAAGWPTTEEVLLGAVLAEHPDSCAVHYASPRTTLVNLLGPRSDAYVALDAARVLTDEGEPQRALEVALALEAAQRSGRLHLGELAEVQLYDRLLVAAWYAGARSEALRAALILDRLRDDSFPGTPACAALQDLRLRTNVVLARGGGHVASGPGSRQLDCVEQLPAESGAPPVVAEVD